MCTLATELIRTPCLAVRLSFLLSSRCSGGWVLDGDSGSWGSIISRCQVMVLGNFCTCSDSVMRVPFLFILHRGSAFGALQAQKTARLCIVRDLTEHDIVSRIMRKDNYLIGMLNRGVLALHVSLPGTRRHFMLTKTLEWNLCFCIFSHMFDSNFRVQSEFVHDVAALRRRFRSTHTHHHQFPYRVVALEAVSGRIWLVFRLG